MIQAKVNVVEGWGERFARSVNRQVQDAVGDAAEEGAKVASAASQSRHRTGLMAEMHVLPVKGDPTGWTGGFCSRAWYARFQNQGTKRGITGIHFLDAGRRAAKKSLIERLNRL